jgi:hypothetical protein
MMPDTAITVITIESVQNTCPAGAPQKQGTKCDGEKTLVVNGVPITESQLQDEIRRLEQQLHKMQNRSESVQKN